MAVQPPKGFLERMKELLGEEEYAAFYASYDNPRFAGIRVNTLKIDSEAFREAVPFELRPIPWCETGYYIDEQTKPGKHPYYHAGLYYIQEPSAMAPVELLEVTPGEHVLDLCAAPGGKSTQIAAKLRGNGMLVTNDINAERTKALAKNIELYGVRNAVVLGESPERIARAFPNFFDKILIDAPCSGEGMFRKDEDMARLWEPEWIRKYAGMQRDILRSAAALLAPGGRMVYSTCTFAPEENEATIADFLLEHPEFRVVPLRPNDCLSPGRPEWLEWLAERGEGRDYPSEIVAQTAMCGRLWPHKMEGEGHFLAVLERQGEGQPQEEAAAYGNVTSDWEGGPRGKRDSRQGHRGRPGTGHDAKG
ncbi:MAG: RsmB/NOP family class I SAM-dependent RNA methyltransferase, partial [Paenibacillaceae bacterium]|nr:RsmB/NOP family class I SAM-dependent RNA methyltransferase [Paenibacillaceae bacterium]